MEHSTQRKRLRRAELSAEQRDALRARDAENARRRRAADPERYNAYARERRKDPEIAERHRAGVRRVYAKRTQSEEEKQARREWENEWRKGWREKNREKIRAQMRANYEKNREKNKAYGRARYQRLKEQIREQARAKRYGLAIGEFEQLLASQGGGCAICGRLPGHKALAVDHDHATGAVRGVLCHRCNMALGGFCDSIALLENALRYLGVATNATRAIASARAVG